MPLILFYGEGCVHCEKMAPLVDQLKKEEKIEIEQLEVWGNEENAGRLADVDKGLCGGVPFFYNAETRAFICGVASYEELKAWASAGKVKAAEEKHD